MPGSRLLPRALKALAHPHYACRPWHVATRLLRGAPPPEDAVAVALPWGHILTVDPHTHIGGILSRHGVYDHTVSEALWRLTAPGACCVDVGAHVGYTASLLAHRSGGQGRVHAVEPHPHLHAALRANASRIRQVDAAPVTVHPVALSSRTGTAPLKWNSDFAENRGTASLEDAAASHQTAVPCQRLDELFPEASIDVLKIDVEGHEDAVLAGAARALADRRIQHVVYENHAGASASCHMTLQEAGHTVFQLGWRPFRPVLWPLGASAPGYLPPSPVFVATLRPATVRAQYRAWGWQCFA